MSKIRVVLVDDHEATKAGLRSYLEREPDIEVIGEAFDSLGALNLVETLDPDVLLLDIELGPMSGIKVTKELQARESRVKILVFSAYPTESYILGALNAGASGYLLKTEPLHRVAEGIRGVYRDEDKWFSPGAVTEIAKHSKQKKLLTDREQEVLQLIAKGHTYAEIGESLGIKDGTVKAHLANIYNKLGVHRKGGAARWAWERGYTDRN